MTLDQLLAAINASGLTPEGLTIVLSFSDALVQRETLRAAMAKERLAQASAVQASEAKIQELQAAFDAIEAQLASRA